MLKPEHLDILRALARQKPVCTLDDFPQRFAEQSGVVVIGWSTPWACLLSVTVTAASVQDRDGAVPSVAGAGQKYPDRVKLYVDAAYAGGCAQRLQAAHGLEVEVVRHPGSRNVGRWQVDQQDLFDTAPPTASWCCPNAGSSNARVD